MSRFKDQMAEDVHNVFLNLDEFAELVDINGVEMPAIIDHAETQKRDKRYKDHIDGTYSSDIVVYVASDRFDSLPAQGAVIRMKGRTYRVAAAEDQNGEYVLTLSQNTARTR